MTTPNPADRSFSVAERFPSTWIEYHWPSWIPTTVRDAILARWSEASGGSPRKFHASAEDTTPALPAIGDRVSLPGFNGEPEKRGRFVHLAGRVGFVCARGNAFRVLVPVNWSAGGES